MFITSALLASVAFAANSRDTYTGKLADQPLPVDYSVEVDQIGTQVTYKYTMTGTLYADIHWSAMNGAGLCYPGAAADKNDCILFLYSQHSAEPVDEGDGLKKRQL